MAATQYVLATLMALPVSAMCLAQCAGDWNPISGVSFGSSAIQSIEYWSAGAMVIAGGDFSISGIPGSTNIASWNGTDWDAIGGGITGASVDCLAVLPDGSLIAGGLFSHAGNISVNNIARWDGTDWSDLGGGTNDEILALAVSPSGVLYAGGVFTTAGDVNATRVARWDGQAWSSLGPSGAEGVDSTVFALTTSGQSLYVGGAFRHVAGTDQRRLACWSSADGWSAVGPTLNSTVLALATGVGGEIYVGGSFTAAGSVAASRIACWDGANWSALGTGLNSDVYTIRARPDGGLYAGGRFAFAGLLPVGHVAYWRNGEWSAMGFGTDNNVTALAASPQGVVFVGGQFFTADLEYSRCVSMWTPGNTQITSQPAPTQGCHSLPAHFAVAYAQGAPTVSWEYRFNGGMWTPAVFGHNQVAGTSFECTDPARAEIDVSSTERFDCAHPLEFHCLLTDPCLTLLSSSALFLNCPGDFNCDGAVDFFDYLDFVAAFASGDLAADFNFDQSIDFFDYLDFVAAFAAGC